MGLSWSGARLVEFNDGPSFEEGSRSSKEKPVSEVTSLKPDHSVAGGIASSPRGGSSCSGATPSFSVAASHATSASRACALSGMYRVLRPEWPYGSNGPWRIWGGSGRMCEFRISCIVSATEVLTERKGILYLSLLPPILYSSLRRYRYPCCHICRVGKPWWDWLSVKLCMGGAEV
jgi:hypothetical protein